MAPILVSVPWGDTVSYDGPREASAVLRAAAPADAMPQAAMQLLAGGKLLRGSDRVPASCLTATVVLSGLKGGKGGFGAMLRAMGKAGGAKATTDFGACRDLYGRRLRHVNDEIRLKKWQDYQEARRQAIERGDKEALAKLENPEEATESGIRGWNLEIPKWADGVQKLGKANKMKRMRRMRRQARRGGADGAGGQGAGDGNGARRVGDGHKFNTLSKDDYVAGAAAPESEDAVKDAVKEGLAAAQAAKRRRLEQEGASEERFLPLQEGGVSGVPTLRWDEDSWLLAMAGDLVVQEGAVLEGLSEFGSARVAAVALTSGQWYYEVTVLTDGLLQIGWADQTFEAQEEADGVGDHQRSWAYDGARGRKWNGEAEGRAYGEQWSRGDVVGCLLDADAGTMRYWLNGKDLGAAFTGVDCATNGGLFPAISLEQGESAEVNLGQRAFAYPPAPSGGARPLWTHAALQGHFARAAAAGEASAASLGLSGRGAHPSAPSHPRGEGGAVEEEDSGDGAAAGGGHAQGGQGEEAGNASVPDEEPLDLDRYSTAQALEALGLEALKRELARRGLKCGGSLQERASRLNSVRGLPQEAIPASLRTGGSKRGKRRNVRARGQAE